MASFSNETPVEFLATGTVTSQVELDENYSVGVYVSGFLKAVVLDSTNTLTFGTPVTVDASAASIHSVVKLTSTKVVATYQKSNDGYAVVLDISGTTITPGTPTVIENGIKILKVEATTLTSSTVATVFRRQFAPLGIYGRRLSISGTTITVGARQTINTNLNQFTSLQVVALSSTKILSHYEDTVDVPRDLVGIISDISGDTYTSGSEQLIYSGSGEVDYPVVDRISDTSFFSFFKHDTLSMFGIVSTVSGTTITPGTAGEVAVFNTDDRGNTTSVRVINSSLAVASYGMDISNFPRYFFVLIDISGTPISVDTLTIETEGTGSRASSIAVLSTSKAIAFWPTLGTGAKTYGAVLPIIVNARFYQGNASLVEKFTLPFSGVSPKGLTLDKTLGTIVVGSNSPNFDPVISSVSPYTTGTASDTNFPETAAITSLKWI